MTKENTDINQCFIYEKFKESLIAIISGVSIQKIKEIVFLLFLLAVQKRIVEKIEEILLNIEKLEKYN